MITPYVHGYALGFFHTIYVMIFLIYALEVYVNNLKKVFNANDWF